MRCLAALLPVLAAAWDDIGYDIVSRDLNEQISQGEGGTFTGGKGILVRSPFDSFEHSGSEQLVVPATFWTNDLFTPTSLYPGNGANGNPMCPSDGHDCDADPNTGDDGPWNYVQLAIVVGSSMPDLMIDYDNIQDQDWGWGVFYPTDSNAVDKRCRWLADENAYDCLGGWIDGNSGAWTDDSSRGGTGGYTFGNPYAGMGGGGTGCHTDNHEIDQTNAYSATGQNLIQDHDCQCNYEFNDFGNWDQWVDAFLNGWTGPMYSLDYSACWMNNPRDMIDLQNAIFWRRTDWTDGTFPWAHYGDGVDLTPHNQGGFDGDRRYWGWNEVPVDKELVNNPLNWDAIIIKLPTDMGSGKYDRLSNLDNVFGLGHELALEYALNTYVWNDDPNLRILVPGLENIGNRPGSYVVLVREFPDSNGNFFREFYCETWTSPNARYQIVYDNDMCYMAWGGGVSV